MSTTPPDPAELDSEDAFGHPALPGPLDDGPWEDGDEDDVDL